MAKDTFTESGHETVIQDTDKDEHGSGDHREEPVMKWVREIDAVTDGEGHKVPDRDWLSGATELLSILERELNALPPEHYVPLTREYGLESTRPRSTPDRDDSDAASLTAARLYLSDRVERALHEEMAGSDPERQKELETVLRLLSRWRLQGRRR